MYSRCPSARSAAPPDMQWTGRSASFNWDCRPGGAAHRWDRAASVRLQRSCTADLLGNIMRSVASSGLRCVWEVCQRHDGCFARRNQRGSSRRSSPDVALAAVADLRSTYEQISTIFNNLSTVHNVEHDSLMCPLSTRARAAAGCGLPWHVVAHSMIGTLRWTCTRQQRPLRDTAARIWFAFLILGWHLSIGTYQSVVSCGSGPLRIPASLRSGRHAYLSPRVLGVWAVFFRLASGTAVSRWAVCEVGVRKQSVWALKLVVVRPLQRDESVFLGTAACLTSRLTARAQLQDYCCFAVKTRSH